MTNSTQAGPDRRDPDPHDAPFLASVRVTALGSTFKADTSDTRDRRRCVVRAYLAAAGAQVAGDTTELAAIDRGVLADAGVTAVDDPDQAAKASDVIVAYRAARVLGLDWDAIASSPPTRSSRHAQRPRSRRHRGRGFALQGNGRPSGF